MTSKDEVRPAAESGRPTALLKGFARAGLVVALAATTVGALELHPGQSESGQAADELLDLRGAAAEAASRSLEGRVGLDQNRPAVSITVDGETITRFTDAATVADALGEAGIVVDEDDRSSVGLGARVQDGMAISIARVEVSTVSQDVVEAYGTTRVESASLEQGTEEVTTQGVDGRALVTYEVTVVDGVEVSRVEIAATVSQQRVDEVITVGTATPQRTAAAATGPVLTGSNRQIGQSLAAARGWTGSQWSCLDSLWQRESGWSHTAQNSSSGAYGIPQALPGSKMASAGADWRTNPATQITWGLDYIAGRYGTPCGAWSHSQSSGWY